jgi:hypothetical protein
LCPAGGLITGRKDNAMTTRTYLDSRFMKLNIGQFDEMDRLTDDQLENLIEDLEAAQAAGLLNLETDIGLNNLSYLIDRYTEEI